MFSKSFLRPLDTCRVSIRKLVKQATLLLGAYSCWHKGIPVAAEQQGRAGYGAHHRTDLQHPEQNRAFVLGSLTNLNLRTYFKDWTPWGQSQSRNASLFAAGGAAEMLPLAVMRPLKEELTRLQTRGIIMLIETSTEWISSQKVVRKSSGKPRICSELKPLSRVLGRSQYPLPLTGDMLLWFIHG